MVFEALYYDGKSSFGNPASVQLLAEVIIITTANDSIEWRLTELNLPDSFFNNNNTVLKHGAQYPYSAIEVIGKEFQHHFKQTYPALNIKATDIKLFQNTGNKVIALVIFGVISLILLSYFFFIPAVAEMIAKRIPQSYEIALGDKMFEQLNAGFQVDSEQTALANAFFHELNVAESYPVKITVVNSDISNAFAFPGGNIVVYDEMFKIMNTKDEFAALLSHEYSHVAKRHITRSLFRNLGTYLVISLVISDVSGIMAVLLQNADNLKSLSYSRSLEQEADEEGMLVMQKAGLNTNGMLDLFQHLGDANKESQEVPEFLSTHPVLESRMKNIKRLAKKNKSVLKSTPELDNLWQKLKALN